MFRKTVSILILFLLVVSVFAVAYKIQPASADGVDWWPMFHHDTNHTGTSTSTGPTTNSTVWTYTTGGGVFSSPAVSGGMVYVGSEDGNVYCLNASTGTLAWNYTTAGEVWSSPAAAGGLVYVGSCDDNVYCLNAATGALVWNYMTAGEVWSSSPAVSGGMVYVGSNDGNVYCLNAATGALVWNYMTAGEVWSSPAVSGGMVYVGSNDGNVYCLNASTGTLAWNYTTGSQVFSSPAIANGMVYFGSEDRNVYCLNASTGTLAWNYTTGDWVDSSPAVSGGMVYVGSGDGNVYCLNASTGAVVWNYPTVGEVDCSPAVSGGMVYVGSSDDNVYCLNASTGAIVWSYATGLTGYSSPAVADDMVYFCSADNNVYCFGPSQTYVYSVTIGANCPTEGVDVSVPITIDGLPSGYSTPYTFLGLTGTHTFAVPGSDASSHGFLEWNTGQRTTTITVSSGGAYTAYYVGSGETLLPVPFHFQEKSYWCGPACLQMVFNYYGENIQQSEIACVTRTIGFPDYGTVDFELRRAAQFSNVSTSMGDVLPYNITGYSLRQLGYSAFEAYGMNLTILENFLDQGKPLILLMWYSSSHISGHFRVAVGYNQTDVFLQDPYNALGWGGSYGGPYTAFSISQFLDLWSYDDYWALYVSPWNVTFAAPTNVKSGTPFQVESTITYPQPLPNVLSTYPASSCNASISLPVGLSLAPGENQTKTIGTGLMQAGNSQNVSWMLVASSSITGTVGITADGMISGSVGAWNDYAAYDYTDRIGATVNFTVNFTTSTPYKTVVGQGYFMNVSLAVTNSGDYAETFNVTAYANATIIGSENVTLPAGNSTIVTFTWNTTGLAYGNYTLSDNVPPANTNFTGGVVTVTIPGDVEGTGKVDMSDIVSLCKAFGSTVGQPNYNPNCDIENNGRIDMGDIVIACANFGQHYP